MRSERHTVAGSISKTIAALVCGGLWLSLLHAQDSVATRAKLQLVADAIVASTSYGFVDQNGTKFSSPDEAPSGSRLQLQSPYTDWRYWNGVLNLAMLRMENMFGKPAYADFAVKNVAFCFSSYSSFEREYKGEGKWNYPFGQLFIMEELDDYGAMGASVIEVQRRDPHAQYRAYIDSAAAYAMNRQNRLDDGTFVRAFPHRWTLWADDLYMSVSFLARMAELTGDRQYFDDAATQVINFHRYLFDEARGIMRHCWYFDVNRPGVAFWGRANGWAVLAQVDLLDRLPANHPERKELVRLLQQHLLGIAGYQSGEGLWHQLLDKEDSYLETSCSAMFTYAVARAVNKGWLEPRYASIALRGWEGVSSRIRPDGQITGVCTGTGVGDDLVHYYTRPTPLNDIHGIGAVLLAGMEVLALRK